MILGLDQVVSAVGANVTNLLGGAGAVIAGTVIKVLWDKLAISNMIKNNMEKFGNRVGLQIRKNAIDKIKDAKLKEIAIREALEAPNAFDRGYDKGILGEKI